MSRRTRARRGISWATVLPLLIISLPYIYYLVDQNLSMTEPLVADSFRYQWASGLSADLFLGGSVSFRLLNYMLGNNPVLVINLVLGVYLLAGILLFFALRTGHPLWDIIIALGLAFMFDSNFLVGIHEKISPEGFFIAMQLVFVAALFLVRGRLPDWLIFAAAVVFIFSRNVAPYVALVSVVTWYLLSLRERPLLSLLAMVLPVIIVAGASANFTRHHDTSLQMNTANNMIRRVANDDQRLAYFRARYLLPTGPWVDACRNYSLPYAATACFDHMELSTSNLSSYNYELRADDQGLSDWMQGVGTGAWQRYILIDRPLETADIFATGFRQNFEQPFSATSGRILPVNYFDISRAVLIDAGLSNLWLLAVVLLIVGGYCLLRPASNTMKLSLVLMVGSLANIFVSYFGDGMEIGRHTYPGYATLGVAQGLFLLALLQALVFLIPGVRWKAGGNTGRYSL